MNKYTFSTKSGKAYYCNSIPGFIRDKSESIIGQLVKHSFEVNKEQSDAWDNQISELQNRLEESGMEGDIIFEYDIVRLGKRSRRFIKIYSYQRQEIKKNCRCKSFSKIISKEN